MIPANDNLRGGMLMMAAMAAFAVEDMIIKALTASLPTGQIVLVLGLGTTLSFLALARAKGAPVFGAFLRNRFVLWRTFAEMTGAVGFVTALALMPLSVASALFQSLPLALTAGAAIFLGEPVGWRRWTAVAVGFAGVVIILRPFGESFDPWAASASALAVASLALRDLATRRIGPGVPTLSLAVWGSAAFIVAGLVLMALGRQVPVAPEAGGMVRLALACVLGVAGYWLMTIASRVGEISAVVPFRYTRIVFALILGAVAFGERPDGAVLLGIALIVGSGLYTFLRERRLSMTRQAR